MRLLAMSWALLTVNQMILIPLIRNNMYINKYKCTVDQEL